MLEDFFMLTSIVTLFIIVMVAIENRKRDDE